MGHESEWAGLGNTAVVYCIIPKYPDIKCIDIKYLTDGKWKYFRLMFMIYINCL